MLVGTAAFVGVFFAVVLRKVLAIRRMPPAQGVETVVGTDRRRDRRRIDPEGIVRVASEEWRATSADGSSIPAGAPVTVTRLDGLVLTVDRDTTEHEAAVGSRGR